MDRIELSRGQVPRHRLRVQGLHREPGSVPRAMEPDVLDLGVQDTGTGGALWSLTNSGVALRADVWPEDSRWCGPSAGRRTPTGAPTCRTSRRPCSRTSPPTPPSASWTPASRWPRRASRRTPRSPRSPTGCEIVTEPLVEGDVSGRLTRVVTEPYLRWCRPCQATHLYEMPFRLAALHAGLELEPGTSPPVLRRIPSWPADHPGGVAHYLAYPPRLDPVRGYLHLLGPARPADVADYLDAPSRDITARWPADAVRVGVEGGLRWALADDVDALASGVDRRGAGAGRGRGAAPRRAPRRRARRIDAG